MPSPFLVCLPVGALLAGLLLELALARVLSGRAKGWLAVISSLVALGGVLALWPAIARGQTLDVRLLTWDGPAALAYHVDGLSLLFALMAAGIGAVVLVYSVAYMASDPAGTRFYGLMLLFIAGMIQLVYSADLLVLYLSWEVIGLCSFLLVGFWYRQREAAAGARKVLVMTHIAGYGLLAAVLLLYARTGSTLWTDPQVAAAFGPGLFLLMLLAAMAKSVQFPLHTWIPDAMAAPTPVSSLLHAACYVTAGVYLVARLHSLGPWPVAWQTLVTWIGTVTLLVGGLFAMIQSDLKRLLAFSTVSQVGYMILGLGLGTPLGVAAGLLHCLNHGLSKGGLFLCAGAVQQATGTRDMDHLGGLDRHMPATTTAWLVLAGSIMGVPLLSGFVSKWLIYNAALEAGQIVPALVAWVVSVITVFYFLKATSGVFLGEETPEVAQAHKAPLVMRAGMAFLALGGVVLGVMPQLAVQTLINPLLPALGMAPAIQVSWLGLTAGSGSWLSTAGLILALMALGVGLLAYGLAQPRRQVAVAGAGAGGTFTGGEPLTGQGRLPASDFSLIIQQGLAPFYRWFDMDRYYLVLWRAQLVVSAALGRASRWLERHTLPALLGLALLLAALIAWGGAGISLSTIPSSHGIAWPLVIGMGLALLALVLAATPAPQARQTMPLMILAGLLAMLGLGISQPLPRVLVLEGAAIVTLALIWRTAMSPAATRAYLLALLLSALAMVSGTWLMDTVPAQLVLALLLTGLAVKLALVPLYLWLPRVAEATPAVVAGLVVAVVDMAAFGELLALRQSAPGLFAPAGPWLALGMVSALAGAALMLARRDLKRLLAFSTVADMGLLLLGVTLGGELGLAGATIGAMVHALAKALLFTSLGVVEAGEPPTLASRGLAARYPLAGAGFLVGALAILGVPPTLGYAAHWRVYGAAAEAGPLLLGICLLAAALALLAYARAIAVCWWGPGREARGREPLATAVALVGLSVFLLLAGLWPGLWSGWLLT